MLLRSVRPFCASPAAPHRKLDEVAGQGSQRSSRAVECESHDHLARMSGGHEANFAYCGNLLIENRNGLVADVELLQSNGKVDAMRRC